MQEADGKFISKIVKGVEIGKAYAEAYQDYKGNATDKAKQVLSLPEFREALAKQGITLRKLNNVLAKQLKATKALVVSKDSTIEYVPDNQAIDNALTKGYKLYGVLKDKEVNIDARSITFSGSPEQLSKVAQEMKELNKEMALDIDGEVI